MSGEIQLISDGDGLAVLGPADQVESFFSAQGWESKAFDMHRVGTALRVGSAAAELGATIAEHSGRWMKLTKESAELAKQYTAVTKHTNGLTTGILRGDKGQFVKVLEFVGNNPAAILTNPAVLTGAAGVMSQLAMQQAMDEITEYLAAIDAKLDDVLRAQKDAVLADMIGVHMVIHDALTVRKEMGRVSEVTWSKVQALPATIARTQAYALRQLDALAEKVERGESLDDVAAGARSARAKILEWLAVLAQCFQLYDAMAILELDRVIDSAPDELDEHRLALRRARENRLGSIARTTEQLMLRMDAAAHSANQQVLLHPILAREIVTSSNHVATGVIEFHTRLGIDPSREALEAKRWLTAVAETKDIALAAGAHGVAAARDLGEDALDRTREFGSRAGANIAGFGAQVGSNLDGLAKKALRAKSQQGDDQR